MIGLSPARATKSTQHPGYTSNTATGGRHQRSMDNGQYTDNKLCLGIERSKAIKEKLKNTNEIPSKCNAFVTVAV